MPEEVMAVAVIGMLCSTGVVIALINAVKSHARGRPERKDAEVLVEMRRLRDEVQQLKRTNDVILTFDSTLQEMQHRITHLERTRATSQAPEEPQVLGLGR